MTNPNIPEYFQINVVSTDGYKTGYTREIKRRYGAGENISLIGYSISGTNAGYSYSVEAGGQSVPLLFEAGSTYTTQDVVFLFWYNAVDHVAPWDFTVRLKVLDNTGAELTYGTDTYGVSVNLLFEHN